MINNKPKGHALRLDPDAKSADPNVPPFVAPPEGAPVYYGFPTVPESETDGWIYGAITDYNTEEPETEGDGFVVAPDGSRAGIVWSTDSPDFYEISPPDDKRWGVYGVRFLRPVSSIEDLVLNFRAILPRLKEKYEELKKNGITNYSRRWLTAPADLNRYV
jgi:hypothetical protein